MHFRDGKGSVPFWRLNSIIMLLIGICVLSLFCASPQGKLERRKAGDLSLVPCVFESFDGKLRYDAELGRLIVLENRSNPKSNLIEIAFVRLKSTAKSPGPPIVLLAGGPGTSGIRVGRTIEFWGTFREAGDLILLDQRSTGMSLPKLECLESWDLPLDQPMSREFVLQFAQEKSRACAEYWRNKGVDLSGYNTQESADDVNDLRKALDEEKFSLFGGNYGSHVTLAVIKRHGKHIHRAVFYGTEGPDHTFKLPNSLQEHMEKMDRLVKEHPELSKIIPDFLGLVESVLGRLEKEPVTVTVTDSSTKKPVKITVGKFDLQWVTARGSASPSFNRALPAHYFEMSRGDFSWLGEEALELRHGHTFPTNAMSWCMDCASGLSDARRERIKQENKVTLFGDLIDFPFPYVCDAWGVSDLGPEFRSDIKSDVPILVISFTNDGWRPLSHSEEVLKGFPNGEYLIVEGLYGKGDKTKMEIRDIWTEFFKGNPPRTTRLVDPVIFEIPKVDK